MREQSVGRETEDTVEIPSWAYGKSAGSRHPHPTEESGNHRDGAKEYLLKRPFDIAIAMVGLAIASPLWFIFAVAIRLEDRGPVFFLQDRRGRNNGKFKAYKFRTMVPDAIERFGNIQATEHDPRVTRVGKLLRATSLDEMPQLLNIARGDMSWVGPRALPLGEVQVQEEGELPDEDIPGFETRSALRPGLTGIAQIFAPRDVPRQEKYRCDAIYATSQSLWLDMRLILLSLWITLRARWETRGSKL